MGPTLNIMPTCFYFYQRGRAGYATMTIPNAEDVGADLDDIVKEVIAEVFVLPLWRKSSLESPQANIMIS